MNVVKELNEIKKKTYSNFSCAYVMVHKPDQVV